MPRVSFQHRKNEVNLVPIIVLSNVLDFASKKPQSMYPHNEDKMEYMLSGLTDESSDINNYFFKAYEYVSALASIAEKITNGQQSFDPIKELITINLTKHASIDSTKLIGALKRLADDLNNQNLDQSDISLLRAITKTLRETTARED